MSFPRDHFGELNVDDCRVRVATHCAIRWRDRARSGLTVEAAAADLHRIAEVCAVRAADQPEWLRDPFVPPVRETAFWIVIGDYAMPVVDFGSAYVAVTCIARGDPIESELNARRAARRRNAQIRKAMRESPGSVDRVSINRRGAGWRKNHRAAA